MAIKQVALAAMTLAAAAAANAQTSSVTLYGVADAFFQYAKADDGLARLQSGGLNGSRIGFRGVEDLGGGLRALFVIESGIALDEGTQASSSAFWNRQSYVGLGGNFGTVTLGRQYTSVYFASTDFSAFSNGSYGPSTGVIGGFGKYEAIRSQGRSNNAVKYETPSFGGFKVGALWGFGETSGSTGKTRELDVYGRYTAGPVDAIVSVFDDRTENTQEIRTITGAVTYTFGAFKVLAGYQDVNDRRATDADGDGFWVGGEYRFGPSTLRAQYVASKPDAADSDTQAFGIGYQYDLSKRTALYTSLTHFRNDGATRWNTDLPKDAADFSPTGRDNVNEFVVGVRHSF